MSSCMMKVIAVCTLLLSSISFAQAQSAPSFGQAQSAPSNKVPAILSNVGIDQKLNAQVPLDLPFRDETGQAVTLRKYFTDKPVIVALDYFNCTMLCPQVLSGLTASLRQVDFGIGKDYRVLTISFDPNDTPQAAMKEKQENLERLGKPGAENGWHFLTGNQDSIHRLTQSLGFRYAWDPATKQFAHATAIMILTPQGKVSKYIYGVQFPPRTLRFSLIEASHDKIGSAVDQILIFCCNYNPTSGKYDLAVSRVLAIGGGFTIIILGGFLAFMFRSGAKKKQEKQRQVAA